MTFEGTVNDVYPALVRAVAEVGQVVKIERPDAVSSVTRELHPVMIQINDPHARLVTSYGRPVNVAFMLAEVLWILAGRYDVEMLGHYNSTVSQFSDDGERFNAPYGYRIRHSFGHDQLEDVIRTLEDDPSSRQATIVISNPVDDKGWDRFMDESSPEPKMVFRKKETKDRACNLLSHFMIRDGALDLMQVVRSNDVMWGLPYNLMQFTHLMEYIARRLGIEMGNYFHVADSMHMYDHHFDQAERVALFDLYSMLAHEHHDMEVSVSIINIVLREEEVMRTRGGDEGNWDIDEVGQYWNGVLWVLKAHSYYKEGRDREALEALLYGDPVYAIAQMRFYYQHRWHGEDFSLIRGLLTTNLDVSTLTWVFSRVE